MACKSEEDLLATRLIGFQENDGTTPMRGRISAIAALSFAKPTPIEVYTILRKRLLNRFCVAGDFAILKAPRRFLLHDQRHQSRQGAKYWLCWFRTFVDIELMPLGR